jgi:hypothetical protein
MGKSKPRIQKDLKPLYKVARQQGWRVEKRKRSGHNVWISPQGKKIFHSSSPSDWRSNLNLEATLKREGLEL